MLQYLAASGHNTTYNIHQISLSVSLQEMSHLKTQHVEVQQHFDEGFHVIRWSNAFELVFHLTFSMSRFLWGAKYQWGAYMNISACCGCYQGLPVQKSTRQCWSSRKFTTTLGSRVRTWPNQEYTLSVLLHIIATGVHAHITVNVYYAREVEETKVNGWQNKCWVHLH